MADIQYTQLTELFNSLRISYRQNNGKYFERDFGERIKLT